MASRYKWLIAAGCLATLGFTTSPSKAQTIVATYQFNNTLAANEAGKPALVSVDPLGLNQFETAMVDGNSQRVFHWNGNGNPATEQAGLSLDATGLVQYENYSVEMTFEFLEASQFGNGWRRIIDTQNRQSDNGFYVEPGNRLQVYPVVTGNTIFTTPSFHHVFLTNYVNGGTREVKAYLDGNLELTSNTDQLNLDQPDNPGHLLNFFLDNVVSNAPNEYADGRIGFLRIYDGIVVPTQGVPEPGSTALFGGVIAIGGMLLKRRFQKKH